MKILCNLIGLILCFSPVCLQGSNFTIQDLGTLANDQSIPSSINNNNMVAGMVVDKGLNIDFIWDKYNGLTCLTHQSSFQPPLINNNNTIAGIFWKKTNNWFTKNTRSKHFYFRFPDGSFQDIGVPQKWNNNSIEDWQTHFLWDDKEFGIVGFNDKKQVLISNSLNPTKATAFAVWQNGDFKFIDADSLSLAYDMNNDGLILGRKWIKEDGRDVPMLVLYDFEQNRTVEIMRDVNLFNKKLNNQGQVVIIQGAKEKNFVGFLWDQHNGLIPLKDFLPLRANGKNQMVGLKAIEDKLLYFLWDQGELLNLNEVLKIGDSDSIWNEISGITGINDNCYIIGQGIFDGKKHAFIISPK